MSLLYYVEGLFDVNYLSDLIKESHLSGCNAIAEPVIAGGN